MSGTAKSDFVAAEEIKVILHGREAAEQERILRWVAESLGLAAKVVNAGIAHPPAPADERGEVHLDAPKSAGPGVVDIKTFVAEKQPKSAMQFAATVAYYHHFVSAERRETITKADLQAATRLAGRQRFSNPATPLDNAVTNGYLDRAGRGEYRLNAVGENLVAMALPGGGNASENGATKRKRRPASKRKSKAR
ncbi:MAG: hypothetical protein AB7O24_00605 [Kofleriaceae bacterium]